ASVCSDASVLFRELAAAIELPPLPEEKLAAERLASELALRLRYDPAELQALIETDSLAGRFEVLLARMREWRGRIQFLKPFRRGEIESSRN
ncbi:MAG: hypothetical protein M3550_01775, partial [Actinomycetota bacterium]|nr:hypothetical protein [Actinomycetota bacterium]